MCFYTLICAFKRDKSCLIERIYRKVEYQNAQICIGQENYAWKGKKVFSRLPSSAGTRLQRESKVSEPENHRYCGTKQRRDRETICHVLVVPNRLSQTGNYRVSYALSTSNTLFSSYRVVDSGVIDYMTHSQQFITYNSRLGNL